MIMETKTSWKKFSHGEWDMDKKHLILVSSNITGYYNNTNRMYLFLSLYHIN